MKVGVVDAGSNSFLLLMAEKKDEKIEYFFDTSRIVGLGHLLNGKVREENFKKALEVVKEYRVICEEHSIDKTVITGTEIFRKIDKKYFEILSENFDKSIILTHREESLFSYRSVVEDEKFNFDPVVVDIGGGSFEIAWKDEDFIFKSIPMGAIFITDKFIKGYPVGDQLDRIELDSYLEIPNKPLVSIGGTGTTIACIVEKKKFDPALIHGKFLKFETLKLLFERMKKMTLEEISSLEGMERGRERIIISGLFLLLRILEKNSLDGLYVSTRGHRYTVARDTLEGKI
ncbi:Ppx/GppA phosphatase family protein [Athalassotoga saccharophila]|uniref:Ppx/GppA phosphatase family protein n=1 Tax=Athalassotoga saccharophila TaxID=1441386 RepID=UPI00137AE549|nr:hypothetical protein [Athalassotoga saccharophila]BBJ27935.1 exopolyphosphatase 2 [Athalassotoga saccharophila]